VQLLLFAVISLAPLIANHWVQPGKLSTAAIQQALMINGSNGCFAVLLSLFMPAGY